MKKVWKILSLVLVFALVMAPVVSLADVPFEVSPEAPEALTNQTGIVGTVIGVLQWVGFAVAIIMVLWLGIQWMLATPSKKAELKGKMWSMAIGIVLLVAGVTILGLVWGAGESVNTTLGGNGSTQSASGN